MPRYSRPPLSASELWQPGPPVRMRDVVSITGWSKPTILRAIESGELLVLRPRAVPGSPIFFQREHVCDWLTRCGWTRCA